MAKPYLSLCIPTYNEAKSLPVLYASIMEAIRPLNKSFEILFIDDGSTDSSEDILRELYTQHPTTVRCIFFQTNTGKAAALAAGFQHAKGDIIITLDADLQDDPKEIPRFLEKLSEGYDLVSGWKKFRYDSWLKNNSSIFYNAITNKLAGTNLHDNNCGFKAYRADVAKALPLYGELHRYIPALALSEGYKITEIPVHHKKRLYGTSKYGLIRFIHGPFDLLTILYLTKYRSRPLHFFGSIGLLFLFVGFLFGAYLTGLKLLTGASIGDRPLLLLSVMLMIMGVQVVLTGLVGEQITSSNVKSQTYYRIKEVLE